MKVYNFYLPPPSPPSVEYDESGLTERGVADLQEWLNLLDQYKSQCCAELNRVVYGVVE